MKVLVIVFFAVLYSNCLFCQNNLNNSSENALIKPLIGTYQFIFDSIETEPIAITSEIINLINSNRHEIEDRTVEISSTISLFIPSYEKINRENFMLLEEFKINEN